MPIIFKYNFDWGRQGTLTQTNKVSILYIFPNCLKIERRSNFVGYYNNTCLVYAYKICHNFWFYILQGFVKVSNMSIRQLHELWFVLIVFISTIYNVGYKGSLQWLLSSYNILIGKQHVNWKRKERNEMKKRKERTTILKMTGSLH